jgi:hypothetical protein
MVRYIPISTRPPGNKIWSMLVRMSIENRRVAVAWPCKETLKHV